MNNESSYMVTVFRNGATLFEQVVTTNKFKFITDDATLFKKLIASAYNTNKVRFSEKDTVYLGYFVPGLTFGNPRKIHYKGSK